MSATTFIPQSIYATQAGLVGANAAGLCRLLTAEEVKVLAGLAAGDSPTFAGANLTGPLICSEISSTSGDLILQDWHAPKPMAGANQLHKLLINTDQRDIGLTAFDAGGTEILTLLAGGVQIASAIERAPLDNQLVLANGAYLSFAPFGAEWNSRDLRLNRTGAGAASLTAGDGVTGASLVCGGITLQESLGVSHSLQFGDTNHFMRRNGQYLEIRSNDRFRVRNGSTQFELDLQGNATLLGSLACGAITSTGNISAPSFGQNARRLLSSADGSFFFDSAGNGIRLRHLGSNRVVVHDTTTIINGLTVLGASETVGGTVSCGSITASGNITTNQVGFPSNNATIATALGDRIFFNMSGSPLVVFANSGLQLRGDRTIGWSDPGFTINPDTGIGRNSAGVVEINNGTPVASGGSYGNLNVGAITATANIATAIGAEFRSGGSGWTESYPFVHWRLGGYTNGLTLYKTFDSGFIAIPSYSQYAFSSTSASNGARDTAFGRASAGVVEINNGTPVASGGTLGSLNASAIRASAVTSTNYDLVIGTPALWYQRFAGHLDGLQMGSNLYVGWSSSSFNPTSVDTAIKRSSDGVLEINNGTTGTQRDLLLRNLTASGSFGVFNATPPASQPAAIDDATDLASALTSLNSLLAAARSYGLIAS